MKNFKAKTLPPTLDRALRRDSAPEKVPLATKLRMFSIHNFNQDLSSSEGFDSVREIANNSKRISVHEGDYLKKDSNLAQASSQVMTPTSHRRQVSRKSMQEMSLSNRLPEFSKFHSHSKLSSELTVAAKPSELQLAVKNDSSAAGAPQTLSMNSSHRALEPPMIVVEDKLEMKE